MTTMRRAIQAGFVLFLVTSMLLCCFPSFAAAQDQQQPTIRFVRNPDLAPDFNLTSLAGKPVTLAGAWATSHGEPSTPPASFFRRVPSAQVNFPAPIFPSSRQNKNSSRATNSTPKLPPAPANPLLPSAASTPPTPKSAKPPPR